MTNTMGHAPRDQIDFSNADLFFQGYLRGWSEDRFYRLRSGRPQEHDITAMMCALQGPAGDAAIEFLLTRAGIPMADHSIGRYEFRSGGDLDGVRDDPETGKPRARIIPDVFVSFVPNDGPSRLVVAVEVKKDADVNYIDCPAGVHTSYSNQVICYPHGCWLPPHAATVDIRYVWLARARDITPDLFPRHALTGDPDIDARWQATPEAARWQAESAPLWRCGALEDFALAVEPHAPLMSRAVLDWLG